MRGESLQVALKEWAVVLRALFTGLQIVLLRKGGLIEEPAISSDVKFARRVGLTETLLLA